MVGAPYCPFRTVFGLTKERPVTGADDNTAPDWVVGDGHHVQLRAERGGAGAGRIYTITITVTDGAGNETTATAVVSVPHDSR